MKAVIVSIAKLEQNYIEEWVKYHLTLGFNHIYLYDNEDEPTYEKLLNRYLDYMTIIHFPKNNYDKAVQYYMLDHFVNNYMYTNNITHVAHIDIDEFVVLKKHKNINEFIKEYIKGFTVGIGMNWVFFGSSNLTEPTNEPVTQRFTKCSKIPDRHIKTIFAVKYFKYFKCCHSIQTNKNNIYTTYIKSTNGKNIPNAFNYNYDTSVIQLNHYKTKTLAEFKIIRTRGRADFKLNEQFNEDVENNFKNYDLNEIEDLTAKNFYLNYVIPK